MARVTPEAAAAAWAAGLGRSSDKITQGVNAVTVAPGAAAAKQKGLYVQAVTASADKWAANVGRVSLQDWQHAMTTKGVQRIASGASAAQPKFGAFMAQLLPYQDSIKASLPPRGDLGANINRMTTFVQKMAAFKRTH